MKSRPDENTAYCEHSPGKDIDNVMVSEVDGRKDKAADDGEKEVKEQPLIAAGKAEDHEDDLGVTTGHAIAFVMLQRVQCIPDKISQEGSIQWNDLEMRQGKPGPDGGKEDITHEGNVVAKDQHKE